MKSLSIFIIALLAVAIPVFAQPVVWTQSLPALSPFYRAGSGVLGNYLYCFGSSYNDIPSAQAYNLTTESWAQSTLPLVGVAGYASVTTDTAIYLIGGWRNSPRVYYNEVQKFVPDGAGPTGTWTLMQEYPLEASGMAAAWDGGNYIYCVGGSLDDIVWLATAYKYDIAGNSWSPIADAPNAVGAAGTAFLNGKFYVAGGWAPNTYDDLLEYDPASDTWAYRTGPPVPIAFSGYGTTDNGSLMFVISGGGDTPQSPLTNAVLTYNPLTDVWTQETPLPATYLHIGGATARFVPPDKVIVAGGVRNTDWQCVTTTYRGTGFPHVYGEGGETCETAVDIPGIPFAGEGNTSNNIDNYNPPFAFPGGRDVVYRYTPAVDECVDISLCSSYYPTRVLVYQTTCTGVPYHVNGDGCAGPNFPLPWVSRLAGVELLGGQTYYIVVDGYDQSSSGQYTLEIAACGPPWVPDEACPSATLFGQPHYNLSIGWGSTAMTPWQLTYDNISGVTEPICAIEFWGFSGNYVGYDYVPCDADPRTFTIAFWADSAGYPGHLVASQVSTLSREAAGEYSWPIWKYTTTLNPCVDLQDGWVSIQGMGTGDPDCYFVWESSPVGDEVDWIHNANWWRSYSDHAFCLLSTLAADPMAGTLPTKYALEQNYPNPFNASTTIAFDLPTAGRVSLRVFDLLGREVAVLKDGMMEAGSHRVTFDGSHLASGIYFARLDAGEFTQTRKLMMLK